MAFPYPTVKSQEEFLPLTAPKVSSDKPEKSIPISWFEKIAPQIPEQQRFDSSRSSTSRSDKDGMLTFGDVDTIAAHERQLRQMGTPEPAEITMLRIAASEEAQQLVGMALSQAQLIEQEARNKGYQSGYDRGYSEGQAKAHQDVTAEAAAKNEIYREDLHTFIAHIEEERKKNWSRIEPEVIAMVFELAKQVIKEEVTASKTVCLSIIQNALRRVADTNTLRIKVNADDLETVRANRANLLSLIDGIPHIEIIEDRRVQPGGSVIDTDAGSIDSRIETQLNEVGETLSQILKQDRV